MTTRWVEFIRFSIVGVLNTGIDFTVFAILSALGVPLLPAHIVSYGCGIGNSFLLNRKWTFKAKMVNPSRTGFFRQPAGQLVRFVALNLFSLTITYELLLWFHYSFGWPLLLSRLMALAVSFAVNFIGSRLWVFRRHGWKEGVE